MLYIEDYGICVPKVLKDMNYTIPKIALYKDDHMEIKQVYNEVVLYLDNDRNMGYKLDHSVALEFISHYDLAYGHVILTGLGLGLIATWLSNKQEVTKITVLENNIHLINYFKTYGDLPNKVEVVYTNAETYTGKCEVLLCNHWIGSSTYQQKFIDWPHMLDNIECNIFYIFRIPKIVKTYENYLKTRIKIPQLPYLTKEKFVSYNA